MNNDENCKPEMFQHDTDKSNFDSASLVSLAIFFACVLYSSIRNSTNAQVGKLTGADQVLMNDNNSGKIW